jgi:DNA-binding transcriptional MerR regulator
LSLHKGIKNENKIHRPIGRGSRISIRTLRYYDEIGLLHPSHRADNGYRFYSDSNSQRLHNILFYRALGFSLVEIKQLLKASARDRQQLLLQQREQLRVHMARLERMQIQLDEALSAQERVKSLHSAENREEKEMKQENRFDVFDGFDPDRHSAEAEEKWGSADAYTESARRTKSYSDLDWKRHRSGSDQLNQEMKKLMEEGCQADSGQAQDVAEKVRLLIDQWFYPCSKEMHANLAEMYVTDERFLATNDKVQSGLAAFIRNAARANMENS